MDNPHDPGPCETLARLALQSERYAEDAEFRKAVDAVLGHPVFDAAPVLHRELTDVLRRFERDDVATLRDVRLSGPGVYVFTLHKTVQRIRELLAQASGRKFQPHPASGHYGPDRVRL